MHAAVLSFDVSRLSSLRERSKFIGTKQINFRRLLLACENLSYTLLICFIINRQIAHSGLIKVLITLRTIIFVSTSGCCSFVEVSHTEGIAFIDHYFFQDFWDCLVLFTCFRFYVFFPFLYSFKF